MSYEYTYGLSLTVIKKQSAILDLTKLETYPTTKTETNTGDKVEMEFIWIYVKQQENVNILRNTE